jgi:predicted DNA-binding protein (MmcQ/YjbR family)
MASTETDARFARPVFARLRRLCLAVPGALEKLSWGHPNFRVGTATFCAFEIMKGRPSVAFRLAEKEIQRLTGKPNFFATPYGRGMWISRWLDVPVDWDELATLVDRSVTQATTKKRRTRSRAAAKRSA